MNVIFLFMKGLYCDSKSFMHFISIKQYLTTLNNENQKKNISAYFVYSKQKWNTLNNNHQKPYFPAHLST